MSNEDSWLKQFLNDLWNRAFRSKYVLFMIVYYHDMNYALIGRNQSPWNENWTLDDKFLKDMEKWKIRHPDSTLSNVMKNITDAVTQRKDFLNLIPDAPFPARSLVKGLGYLLALGVVRPLAFWNSQHLLIFFVKTIARAKDEVFAFITEVITWLSTIEASFGNRKGGSVVGLARSNLKHIR
jgi:hypothetical protein